MENEIILSDGKEKVTKKRYTNSDMILYQKKAFYMDIADMRMTGMTML